MSDFSSKSEIPRQTIPEPRRRKIILGSIFSPRVTSTQTARPRVIPKIFNKVLNIGFMVFRFKKKATNGKVARLILDFYN